MNKKLTIQIAVEEFAFYDLYNDPREVMPKMLPGFTTKTMFDVMRARHELWEQKYPNTKHPRGMPLTKLAYNILFLHNITNILIGSVKNQSG